MRRYVGMDHLGSVIRVADSALAPLASKRYRPFGAVLDAAGDAVTDRGFTGQTEDAVAGLTFYRSRYYEPGLGRFVQPDSIVPDWTDPQSLNRYSYVLNNPLKYTDPTGHAAQMGIVPILVLAGAAAGGVAGSATEIRRQYAEHGHVSDWSRVAGSAATGAFAGGVVGLSAGLIAASVGLAGLSGAATVALHPGFTFATNTAGALGGGESPVSAIATGAVAVLSSRAPVPGVRPVAGPVAKSGVTPNMVAIGVRSAIDSTVGGIVGPAVTDAAADLAAEAETFVRSSLSGPGEDAVPAPAIGPLVPPRSPAFVEANVDLGYSAGAATEDALTPPLDQRQPFS